MDTNEEYIPTAGLDEPDEPSFVSNSGSIFPHAHDFTVTGGTFTTNNYPAAPDVPSDFRMIPWGDIDLQRDLSVNTDSGVIDRRGELNCVRRVYSAKVDGRSSDVTVAVYQGNGAQEEWRRDIATYVSMRHPNIVQICAGASRGNLHATIFHGDLIPFNVFMTGRSPIMTVYLFGLYLREWMQVAHYFQSMFPQWTNSYECTLWIRSSSGRLCADFVVPSLDDRVALWINPNSSIPNVQGPTFFDAKNDDTIAIHCLSLEQYHTICVGLGQPRVSFASTTGTSFTLGAVLPWPMPSGEHSRDVGFEVAYLPEVGFECVGWCVSDEDAEGNDMENGWIRYDTHESFNPTIIFDVYLSDGRESWLTQANYIFSSLQIASKLENHVLVTAIHFELIGPKQTVDSGCPPGYLFLCPEQHFQVGTSSFKWPDNPAYWSLDPSGVERLSMEEATQLGFPRFTLTTEVHGVSWDTSVYAGLRQFHQAKGFDPESQDVARHLGLPLYQLSGNIDPPFAHVEEDENRGGDEGGEDVNDDAASHEGNDSPSHGTPVDERDDTEDLALVAEGEDCDLLPGDADTEPRSMSPVPGAATYHIQDTISQSMLVHSTDEDIDIPISLTFKIIMNMQLVLMLFLATCWVYNHLQ